MPHSGTRRGQLSGPLGKFLNLAFCGLKHWPSSSVKSPWLRGYSTCATTDWPFANNRSEMPSLSSVLVLRSAGQAKPSVFSTNAASWYGPTTQTLSQSVGTAAFRSIRLLPEASTCSEILSEWFVEPAQAAMVRRSRVRRVMWWGIARRLGGARLGRPVDGRQAGNELG